MSPKLRAHGSELHGPPKPRWPITVSQGTNRLIKAAGLVGQVKAILAGRGKSGRRPALWDGRTAERAAESLRRHGLPRLPKDHKAAL